MDWLIQAGPTVLSAVVVALLLYIARRVAAIALLPERFEALERDVRDSAQRVNAELRELRRVMSGR